LDIERNLRPIVADLALRVFARRNVVSISAEREAIATEIRRSIQEAVQGAFGLEIVALQLSRIEYSPRRCWGRRGPKRPAGWASRAVNPTIVQYETARRWNRILPATMLGGGVVRMFRLPAAR